MATTTNTKRHDEIAAVIRGALSPIFAGDSTKADAAAALQDAADGAVNAREMVMGTLAAAAEAGRWTEKEVDVAAKLAISKGNAETPKAVSTFVSEAKRAMHPAARSRFAQVVAVRDGAWDAETAQPKDQPRPCKAAFSRKYHMLVTLLGEAAEGRVYTSTTVLDLARSRDPALDPDKVTKRIRNAVEALQSIFHDFQVDDLQVAIETLQNVDAEDLRRARNARLSGTADTASADASTDAASTTVVVTDGESAEDADELFAGTGVTPPSRRTTPTTEPATGASDLLDDILTDFQAAA